MYDIAPKLANILTETRHEQISPLLLYEDDARLAELLWPSLLLLQSENDGLSRA